MNHLRTSTILCALALAACGGSGTTNDAGTSPGDTGVVNGDSGPPPPPPTLSVAMGAIDLSCHGTSTAPTGGADVTFTGHVYDFQTGTGSDVPTIGVDVFPDNLVADTCAGTCVTGTTDLMGQLSITAPGGGWFAYRVAAGTGAGTVPVLTIGYNRTAPTAASVVDLPSVSSSTIGLIPSLFARQRVPGTGIVSGEFGDCTGASIQDATLRVFQGATELVTGPAPTDFFVGYFRNSLPSSAQRRTSADGLFAAANIPVMAEPIRVELWGVMADGQAPSLVGCEEARVFANGVTIISLGPLRSDYPLGSGCAGRI